MNIPLVDLQAQYSRIHDEIDAAIRGVISSAAFVGGSYVKCFEDQFASYCGVKHCVGVGNGTDALFIALKTLGVGPGDEVITAANTFIATSEAITMAGARVVFVDINPSTHNLDTTQVEQTISKRTKAVIPVHLFGQPADMEPIVQVAKQRGLFIVGDAAQAHGSLYHAEPVARWAHITCFSFYPGKNLGAYGDGGALVTDRHEWAAKARMFANHGRVDKYNHELEGVNSRLDGIQAAVLSVKLKHLDEWNEQRRRNARLYDEYLKDAEVTTPREIENVEAVYHLYVIRVREGIRWRLQDFLQSSGISSGIHYPIALPYLKAYSYLGYDPQAFPEALRASREILSLPMFPELSEPQIRYVADKVMEFTRRSSL